jgi:hypothetical protein
MRYFLSAGLLAIILAAPTLARAGSDHKSSSDSTAILFSGAPSYPAQGGPGIKTAFFSNGTALLVGGRGAFMLGENTALGVASYSLASDVETDVHGLKRDISFTYFGLVLDNFFASHRLLFMNVSTLVGPGFVSGSERNLIGTKDNTTFFIVEPELNVMLNVTKELRIGIGVSYRLTAGSDVSAVVGMPVNGLSCSLSMMYGKL